MSSLQILSTKLKHRLRLPLPGIEAQLRMANVERRLNKSLFKIPENAKVSAVLILLYEKEQQVFTTLIQRTEYKGVHSRQVSFPGGKKESKESLEQTAIREAEEEIGIVGKDVRLIGRLTELYIPPSNFLVHPFIGQIHYTPDFFIEKNEVEELIEISIDELCSLSNIKEKEIKLSSGVSVITPYFSIAEKTVWGATAMIISEFSQVISELD